MMDPRTAQDRAEQVLEDIQAQLARSQTTTAQECKTISGRRRKSPEERLAQLQARAEQLEAALKAKRRKAETREKIILGGWVLALCRQPSAKRQILNYLGKAATMQKIKIPAQLAADIEQAMRETEAAKAAPK